MTPDTDPIDLTDERPLTDDGRKTDVPTFSIERTPDDKRTPQTTVIVEGHRPKRKRRRIFIAAGCLLAAVAIAAVWHFLSNDRGLDLPVSVTDSENIELLAQPLQDMTEISSALSDSVFGVAFDMYRLDGLAASLESSMPDPDDPSLRFFFRSADYRNTSSYNGLLDSPLAMGSLVVEGRTVSTDPRETRYRPGYVAISPHGRSVIGVSLSDKVMNHVAETGGSFFRQTVLLSAGKMPREFYLHGKVERAAIGRMPDGSLHYVVTRHRETMYDFADAMREYGFVDAIYVTGGNAYDFHRASNGDAVVSERLREKYLKYRDADPPLPLLVFRSRKN